MKIRLAAVALLIAGVSAAVTPAILDWREAATRVDEVVTIEGEVTAVRVRDESYVLEFSDDPDALHAVVMIPLFGGAPRDPESVYRGHRVRATGRVQRFQGRPELVVRSPALVEVVDVTAPTAQIEEPSAPPEARAAPAPAAPAAPVPAAPVPAPPAVAAPASPAPVRAAPAIAAPPSTTSAPAAPPPPVPAPAARAPVAAAPAPTPVTPSPAVAARTPAAPVIPPPAPATPATPPPSVEQPIADAAPCERARAGWRDGAADVQSRLAALGRCLQRISYDCARERAALTPALDALAEFERRVGDACR